MAPIVIVGTGLAGYTVAREFRKLDQRSSLMLVTADAGQFYSKPMLSNALADGKTAEALANADAVKMTERLKAEIRTGVRTEGIDPSAGTIQVSGETLSYASLVLAVGADPIRLSLQGDAADAVLSVNNRDDYARFREAIAGHRKIAIMGAGLIGCEFANDLAGAGYSVNVVDPAPWPLGRLLPAEAGAAMGEALAKVGVRWHLGRTVNVVEKQDRGYLLTLSDGTLIHADAVLSAIGLRPRTDLAQRAGLDTTRGIVVGRTLQTSAPRIYALGDCAEVEGLVLPFVMPIMHAGRALAATLSGEVTPVTYPAMPVVVKTPAWPTVVSPPPAGVDGSWEIVRTDAGVRALFRNAAGRLEGFALSGDTVTEKNALAGELPPLLS